jgi:putative acetyltransferase
MVYIRDARDIDRDGIRKIHLSAFSAEEGPVIAALALELLSEDTDPETISLLAEVDGSAAGHVVFSPVMVDNDGVGKAYILAPLAVKPQLQNRGIGSALIGSGVKHLAEMGVSILFVYGDPKYYGRFGFDAGIASAYAPPYELQYPFGWQAKVVCGDGDAISGGKLSCVAPLSRPELW